MKTRKEMLEEFVAADPDDSFSRYALALECDKAGLQQEAIALLREVIKRDAGYVAAYYHLGRMLARDERVEEALDVYRRGLGHAATAGDQRTRSEIQEAIEMLK